MLRPRRELRVAEAEAGLGTVIGVGLLHGTGHSQALSLSVVSCFTVHINTRFLTRIVLALISRVTVLLIGRIIVIHASRTTASAPD